MITRQIRPPTTPPAMSPALEEGAGARVEGEVVDNDGDDDNNIVGLTLLKVMRDVVSTIVEDEDVVSTTVEDEDVVDDTVEDDVEDGETVDDIDDIVIASPEPQHAVFPPPQHQVVELLAPEQEVTCAFPFESYTVPRTN